MSRRVRVESLRAGQRFIFAPEFGGEGEVVTALGPANNLMGTRTVGTEELDFDLEFANNAEVELAGPFTIPRPDWVSDRLVAERGEFAGFQMFTREGNDSVGQTLTVILRDAERLHPSPKALNEALRGALRAVAKNHPEIHDTEPRGAILDVLDAWGSEHGYRLGEDVLW